MAATVLLTRDEHASVILLVVECIPRTMDNAAFAWWGNVDYETPVAVMLCPMKVHAPMIV